MGLPGVPPVKSTDLQDSRVGEPKAKAGHGPSRWRSPGRGPRRRSRRDGLRAASAGPFGSRRDRPTRRAAPDRRKSARDQGPPPPACRASPVAMRRQRTCAEAQMVAAPASPLDGALPCRRAHVPIREHSAQTGEMAFECRPRAAFTIGGAVGPFGGAAGSSSRKNTGPPLNISATRHATITRPKSSRVRCAFSNRRIPKLTRTQREDRHRTRLRQQLGECGARGQRLVTVRSRSDSRIDTGLSGQAKVSPT
jgi:hypothetical protein